jgi:hypothetical protein
MSSGFDGLTYGNVQGLTLTGVGDVFNVNSTSVPTTLDSGGDCTFNIGNGNLQDIHGSVTVNGVQLSDTVVLNGSTASSPDTYHITSSSVTWDGLPGLIYNFVPGLTLNGAAGSTYYVASTAVPTTLNGTGTGNSYVIGYGESLDLLHGKVTVQGSSPRDMVMVHDTSGSNYTYTITGTSVTQSGSFGGLTYGNIGSLLLQGEAGAGNTYDVLSTSVETTLNAVSSGASGTDKYNVGSTATSTGVLTGIHGALHINGGDANSSLTFFDQGQSGPQLYNMM